MERKRAEKENTVMNIQFQSQEHQGMLLHSNCLLGTSALQGKGLSAQTCREPHHIQQWPPHEADFNGRVRRPRTVILTIPIYPDLFPPPTAFSNLSAPVRADVAAQVLRDV